MNKRALLLALCACTETRDAIKGTQSIEVELVTPANPGDVKNRLGAAQRTVTVNLRAKDAENNLDPSFSATLRVYAQFLGTLTPELSTLPKGPCTTSGVPCSVEMVNGMATATIDLSTTSVFGPTTLWFDNGTDAGPDYQHGAITGTSPTLWYRDPYVADLQAPGCENLTVTPTTEPNCMPLQDPLGQGPLEDKQIRVGASRHNDAGGDRGLLVVTSVFSQGYTASDVECATGLPNPTPPCVLKPHPNGVVGYDHAMVFTFSAARDQYFRPLVVGEVIESFNGGLSEFNGLTEVGFPRTQLPIDLDPDGNPRPPIVNTELVPAPTLFEVDPTTGPKWFGSLSVAGDLTKGRINFERNEAGLVEFQRVLVCAIDDGPDGTYTSFKQWAVDPDYTKPNNERCRTATSADRAKLISLITAGTDFTTDPHTLVGKELPKVIGIVRPVNLPGFDVWIVYPRGKEDIVTQ
jgi:hypothetical protein